ncbi:unnamed protein product [Gulo gulo]|uniref:Uncharacterized protein n=1 Tax=Gulo gulo TaxID=48420 RepID=A0A9X9PUT2_GULGU|nr:unnamed protein product [Gulo gulo]
MKFKSKFGEHTSRKFQSKKKQQPRKCYVQNMLIVRQDSLRTKYIYKLSGSWY